MAYLSLAQAKQALGNDLYVSAYDDFTDQGTPNDTVLQEDIDYVDGVINKYLIKTYDVIGTPITAAETLAILKGYAEHILKYKAYQRFDDSEVPEVVVDRYREVTQELRDIADGIEMLPGQAQNTLTGAVTFGFNSNQNDSESPTPVFRRTDMTGF